MESIMIDVLLVEAGVKPRKVSVENDIKTFRRLLTPKLSFLSDVDVIMLEKDVALLYNKEGVLLGLTGNRRVENLIIAGSFYVVGVSNGNLATLSQEKQAKYAKRFEKVENHTDKDVSKAYWEFWYSSIVDDSLN